MTQQEEYVLIDRILAGERNLYAHLVDSYKSYAFTLALKITNVRGDAEEAAQDAFIKAFHNLQGFNREAKFSTWLYRIVFNTAVSYKRKNKRQFDSIESTIIEHRQEAEGNLEKKDKSKFIAEAMRKLNDADQLALTMYYLQEFSLEEIAEVTGMQANTLKVRVHRARQRLADELTGILKQEALTL
ncbi:MAG: sigma-70 family RNA polymerase sigma factor [Flammeovirgaceae bacterium]|nr:sigma-70 family RNA polymerase sigma factor [Flammeovirgaceae bacterium]